MATSSSSRYSSRQPDTAGYVRWPREEHQIWQTLILRQRKNLPGRACEAFLDGLRILDLPVDEIPQLPQLSQVLRQQTGWQLAAVPALISFDAFFSLLAERKFPVATFIRRREDLDYLQEPDLFHEIFGHCPLLTNPAFAHFTQLYGQLGKQASKAQRVYLARLYWFTVEFGLLQTANGLRIYGGGILSSPGETVAALESSQAVREPFDLLTVLRTPYRIDIMQPIYYVLSDIEQLYEISRLDIMQYVEQAKSMGLLPALYDSPHINSKGKDHEPSDII